MAITLTCEAMGYGNTHEVSGGSFAEILADVQKHAMEEHGVPEKLAHLPEQIEIWEGAIRQSARPSKARTPRPKE